MYGLGTNKLNQNEMDKIEAFQIECILGEYYEPPNYIHR